MPAQRKFRVIIADDQFMMRQLIKQALQAGPFDIVAEAVNGTDAVAKVSALAPDIITIDNNMPELNGLDALIKIKAEKPDTVVIMITAEASQEAIKKAMQHGVNGFLTKPFSPSRIVKEIAHAVLNRKAKA